MLCFEGIAQALNIFLGRSKPPVYKVAEPKYTLTIEKETAQIRPYAAAAILRGVTFDQRKYESFISLQDKLHSNLCRNRTLVAIGTHDLDTIKGPFVYKAPLQKDINFVPLNQSKRINGTELVPFYEKDKNLGKFLSIISDSPVYPIIADSNDTVCSLPPIINSNHSKITLDSKNVLIECTATDRTKLEIVLNQVCAMFCEYTKEPFTVEAIKVISEHNGESRITPSLAPRKTVANVSYINSCLGLKLTPQEISDLLSKMSLIAKPSKTNDDILDIEIPATRSDILHQCDIMEDVAVGYGFNNLKKTIAKSSSTIAEPLPINKISDILRRETAQAGWLEVMPLILCSHDENFAFLNRVDDGKTAVKLANPKTVEYQVVRTSLVPGLLKTIRENRRHSLPIKVFESSDVCFKDDALEVRAYNQRNWVAVYAGKQSGFETVQGLLDHVMKMMRVSFVIKSQPETYKNAEKAYYIKENNSPTFFPGRGADIYFRSSKTSGFKVIGQIGVLHPDVLNKFEIPYAASSVEINAEVFL